MSLEAEKDYAEAFQLKEKGNEAFAKGDNQEALKCYSKIFIHIGMNPCMNFAAITGQPEGESRPKNPVEKKTDELRLAAFNNMGAVYAKINNWEACKEKCCQVLKHDGKNVKALFRRAKAYRHLNLFDLALADLKKMQELTGEKNPTVEEELKLLKKDEKKVERAFEQQMHKGMMRNAQLQKQKQKKKENKNSTTTTATQSSSDPTIATTTDTATTATTNTTTTTTTDDNNTTHSTTVDDAKTL